MSLQALLDAYGARGHRARAVPVARLEELREETDAPAARALLDPALGERFLPDGYDYALARRDPGLRSVVIVATPSPQALLTFHAGGRAVPVRLGPSYVDRGAILAAVKEVAAAVLGPAGHRTAAVTLPKKLLAARSGLGRYGRNNLLYVPGLGSFHRLTAFATDAPCPEDAGWGEPRLLEACERCTACLKLCPTGAIGGDRFLLHAERCLTFSNEVPAPLPAWLEPAWHECLVGCLRCQHRCPENRAHRDRTEPAGDFSEEETSALLDPDAPARLPPALRAKLDALSLLRYLDVLPRNLRLLLAAGA